VAPCAAVRLKYPWTRYRTFSCTNAPFSDSSHPARIYGLLSYWPQDEVSLLRLKYDSVGLEVHISLPEERSFEFVLISPQYKAFPRSLIINIIKSSSHQNPIPLHHSRTHIFTAPTYLISFNTQIFLPHSTRLSYQRRNTKQKP
jgi:hypothetical protein